MSTTTRKLGPMIGRAVVIGVATLASVCGATSAHALVVPKPPISDSIAPKPKFDFRPEILSPTNLIQNGSFEAPRISTERSPVANGATLGTCGPLLTTGGVRSNCWTVTGSTTTELLDHNLWPAADGLQSLHFAGPERRPTGWSVSRVAQAVPLEPNREYRLDFRYTGDPFGNHADFSLDVDQYNNAARHTSVGLSGNTGPYYYQGSSYTDVVVRFRTNVDTTNGKVTFEMFGEGNTGIALDSVRLRRVES